MSHAVKGLLVVIGLTGLMAFGWYHYRDFLERGQRPPEGTRILNKIESDGVPQIEAKDYKGELIRLSDYKDRVVLVNFWASWCAPCVDELPSLIQLIKAYEGKVVLLAVSADYEIKDMQTFLKAFDADLPDVKVIWDKDMKIAKRFGTEVLPESYILGHGNQFIRKVAGVEDWYSKSARRFFDDLVQGKNPNVPDEPKTEGDPEVSGDEAG